jgi:dienelactone hydrolase
MAEVLLLHHAQGLTTGCRAFADDLRAAGHTVHAPDLYEGRTFATLSDGVDHARAVGFDTIIERGRAAAEQLPNELVYLGMSLGVLPAQALAQNRPGARAAVLLHGAMPIAEFGQWPDGVALQLHTMEADELGDLDVARELAGQVDGAELFTYPGDQHLFTDRSLAVYDAEATALVGQRVLALLERIDYPRDATR